MKTIKLNIEDPCHENWNKMTPNTQGRHCLSCAKTVVNFTTMSDNEIIQFLEKNTKSSLCGRFQTKQLNRDIKVLKPSYFSRAAMIALAVSAISPMIAQSVPEKIEIRQLENQKTLTVTGIVKDKFGDPVMFANVAIYKNDKLITGESTDFDGIFSIKFKGDNISDFSFKISHIEFAEKEVILEDSPSAKHHLTVFMKEGGDLTFGCGITTGRIKLILKKPEIKQTISGTLTDQDGEPVMFANIAIYQNDVLITGESTDMNGYYKINDLPSDLYDLKISHIAFQDQLITNIRLEKEPIVIDQVLDSGIVLMSVVTVSRSSKRKRAWNRIKRAFTKKSNENN